MLGCREIGMVGCWDYADAGVVACWEFRMLGRRDVGMLGFGSLGFWDVGMWDVEVWTFRLPQRCFRPGFVQIFQHGPIRVLDTANDL